MSSYKMREEFEVWVKGQECYFGDATESLSRCDEEPDEYLCGAVHGAWLGWQASREAVVIDLPKDLSMRLPQEVRDICVYWIENTGLKVKP
ncbi:hypothetical protein [Pseudomonas syringae]|uniref:hypothetical protein n=1 Tax=Pseudomonas syringae TaxID=317 RepID=UPI0032D8DC61